MQLTRILSLASSIEAERVRLITPALAAQYACKPAAPRSPAIDAVEIIEPPPVLRISGTACLMPRNTARSRIEKLRSQFSALVFSSGPALDILLTRDVGELEDRVAAVLLAVSHRRLTTFAIKIGNHDRRAFARKPNRGRASDSARRTSDHCNLLFEFPHEFSPYWF